MENSYSTLFTFIDLAVGDRHYSQATADGYRTALNKIKTVLRDDEAESLDVFMSRRDAIINAFYQKYSQLSTASLKTYVIRLEKVLNDYTQWGINKQGWDAWKLPTASQKPRKEKTTTALKTVEMMPESLNEDRVGRSLHQDAQVVRHEVKIPTKHGGIAFISAPSNLTKDDVDRMEAYMIYLKTVAVSEPPEQQT